MIEFFTAFCVCGTALIGWNKRLSEGTKVGWFVFVAILLLIFILGKIF